MRPTNSVEISARPDELHRAMAQLLAAKPRIRNTVRRVVSSGNIARVLADWTLAVTLPDG
ncbi:hypothetical protein [Caballeronia sp. SL2Y3]|uniref:hypothetical protein n=1 Tax=Caballeronia sp. SL2Y3 TaxID=2878151 RepID=UPI001FD1C179|nr:hypothetical protein [Caballeronia sp. SL2Y3]